ncbi:hypothetical protein C3V36_13655 [Lachnospiraceae bacterium oral taxon 500]|mgnify:CR=1 FL=1|nr:hypothetical protein C3V36_13655 [Lachnospiraceae bacterium oral taxon 500]
MAYQNILIVTNVQKDPEERFTGILKEWLTGQGKNVSSVHRVSAENIAGQELIITLGGDGTIINVAKEAAARALPVLGINLGHLGFLAETEESCAFSALTEIFNGRYTIEKRMMLSAYGLEAGEKRFYGSVLNEVVLKRHDISRMMAYTLRINGNLAGHYRADGVILSTPTGSTAYNLSAGGPIILPHCENIAVTPICPHSLSARPLVLSATDVIELEFDRLHGLDDFFVTLDGSEMIPISPGTRVQVIRSERTTNLIRRENTNFFSVLNDKL